MLPELLTDAPCVHPVLLSLPLAWLTPACAIQERENRINAINIFEEYKKEHTQEIAQSIKITTEPSGIYTQKTYKNLIISLHLVFNESSGLQSALANIKPEYIQQAITFFLTILNKEALIAAGATAEQITIAKTIFTLFDELNIQYQRHLYQDLNTVQESEPLILKLVSLFRNSVAKQRDNILKLIRLLLNNYLNLNINASEIGFNVTALVQAVRLNNVDIVSLLLSHQNIRFDIKPCDGTTLISEGIIHHELTVAKMLLYYGVPLSLFDEIKIIEQADLDGNSDVIALIQEHHAVNDFLAQAYPYDQRLKLKREYHQKFDEYLKPTSLHLAVKEANLDKIELILNADANVYFKNRAGESAFQLICQCENSDLIRRVFNIWINKVKNTTDPAIEDKYAELIIDLQEAISANYPFKMLFPDEEDFAFLNRTFKFIFKQKIQDQISSIEKRKKNLFFYSSEEKTKHLQELLNIVEQTSIRLLAEKIDQWKNKKLIRTDTTNKASPQQITVKELMGKNLCLFSLSESETKSTQCVTEIEHRLSRLGFAPAE